MPNNEFTTAAELGAAKAQRYLELVDLKKRSETFSAPFSLREQNELKSLKNRPKNATVIIAQAKFDKLNQFPTSLFTSKTEKGTARQAIKRAEAYEYGYALKSAQPDLVNPALNQTIKAGVNDALYDNDADRNLQERINKAQKNVASIKIRFFSSTATQAEALKELADAKKLYNNFQEARQKAEVPPPASMIEAQKETPKEVSAQDHTFSQRPVAITTTLSELIAQEKIKATDEATRLSKSLNDIQAAQENALGHVPNDADLARDRVANKRDSTISSRRIALQEEVIKAQIQVDNLNKLANDDEKTSAIQRLFVAQAYQEAFESTLKQEMNVIKEETVQPIPSRLEAAQQLESAILNVQNAQIKLDKLNNLNFLQRFFMVLTGQNFKEQKATAAVELNSVQAELTSLREVFRSESADPQALPSKKTAILEQENAARLVGVTQKEIERLEGLSNLLTTEKAKKASGISELIAKENEILTEMKSIRTQKAVMMEIAVDEPKTQPPIPSATLSNTPAAPDPVAGPPFTQGFNNHQQRQPKLSGKSAAEKEPLPYANDNENDNTPRSRSPSK